MEIPVFVYSLLVLLIPGLTAIINTSLQRMLASFLGIPMLQDSISHLWYIIRASQRQIGFYRLRNLAFLASLGFSVFAVISTIAVSLVASHGTEVVRFDIFKTRFGNVADIGLNLPTDHRSFTGTHLYERFQHINKQFSDRVGATVGGNKSNFQVLPQEESKLNLSREPVFSADLKNPSALTGAFAISWNIYKSGKFPGLNKTNEPGLWYNSFYGNGDQLFTIDRYQLVPIAWRKSPLNLFWGLRLLVFGHQPPTRSIYRDSIERYVYDEIRCDVQEVRMFQEFRQSIVSMWPSRDSSSKKSLEKSYDISRQRVAEWGLRPPTSSPKEVSSYFNYSSTTESYLGRHLFWDYFTPLNESINRRSFVACHFGTAQHTVAPNQIIGSSHHVQCTVDRISVYQRSITEREKKNCQKAESKYGLRTDKPILASPNDTLQAIPNTEIRYYSNVTYQKGPLRIYQARLYTKVSQPMRVVNFSAQHRKNFYRSDNSKSEHLISAKEINITKDMRFEQKHTPDWPSLFMGRYSISDTKVKTSIDLSWEGLLLLLLLLVIGIFCFLFTVWRVPKHFRQSIYLTVHEIKHRQDNMDDCCSTASIPAAPWDITVPFIENLRDQVNYE